ncbi:MAG: SGNH/GDSL hydrolase family protein [Saprospiraceae bacterium]|nr:SGNH/GDSL hydrolase family protein [Saprospiraceae bacterium]
MADFRKYQLFISLFCVLLACNQDDRNEFAGPDNSLNDGILKILFLGNSHTFYNDLPGIVKQIATNLDYPDSIFIRTVAPGGYSLQDHLLLQETQKDIEGENWDVVVLQENAVIAATDKSEAEVLMIQPALKLGKLIKENNGETQVIWYLPQAYRNGIIPCESDPGICSFNSMLDRIRQNYLTAQSVVESKIAPAGVIWKVLFSKDQSIELHAPDDIHPNKLGSWVSAATIYATLFNQELKLSEVQWPEDLKDYEIDVQNTINQTIFRMEPNWTVF